MSTVVAGDPLVLSDLPSAPAWDFGGFPYGLEPLALPPPGRRDATGGSPGPDPDPVERYGPSCWLILTAGAPTAPGGDGESAPADVADLADLADQLFWFRWITGHQVSFVIWRLMADTVAAAVDGRLPARTALASLRHAVHGYCAMLLYCGSCPREVYESVIRRSMYLQHRAFSGSWAPDYGPVRDLFRARPSPLTQHPHAGDLLEAVRLYHVVHDGVAAKLVPSGKSLLHSATRAQPRDVRLQHLIYDNYFLTYRAPVSRHEVVAQLLRRLVAVTRDVAANGFHPAGADDGDRPEELRRRDVTELEERFAAVMFDLATYATGLPEDSTSRHPDVAGVLAQSVDVG